MAAMNEVIEGWPVSSLVPGHYGQNKWGVGKISIGEFPVVVGCTGTKTSDGSLTVDVSMEQAFTLSQALALVGKRSTATQQAKAAFTVEGANVVLLPPAEAAGAVAATITITFGGSWTTAGSVFFWVNGERVEVIVGSSDDTSGAATNAETAFGSNQTLPVTADSVAAVTTLTVASKGTQGNSYLLGWDLGSAPAGLTVTVAGGTALHSKLVPFSGGTGTESIAAILELAATTIIDYWAVAQTDATNAGLMKTFVTAQAGPTIAHLESAHWGHNGTFAAATTFASTTLNFEQGVLVWLKNCETHPAAMAANSAALRSSVVGANPNYFYAGKALKGIAPQRYKEDKPGPTEQESALHLGTTVLLQNSEGDYVRIVRDCVTHCLTSGTQNLNTYGWPHVDVPFRMRKEFAAEYLSRREGNPSAGPDPIEGEKAALPGMETPSSLGSAFQSLMLEREKQFWVRDVATNPVQVWWDYDRKCLMYYNTCKVGYQNLQCGGTTAQTV